MACRCHPLAAPAQWVWIPKPFSTLCGTATLPSRKDTIICRSEGDFCLNFSSFSSCLISLFWTRLHFLISACTEKEGYFLGIPRGPGPTPAHLEVRPAHPGLLYLGTIELQGTDDLGLQPLDLQGTCGSVKEAEKTAFMSSACTRGKHTQGP